MLEIPFLVVSAMSVQIYILAAIFLLTYRLVTPRRLSPDIQTSLRRHDYVTRRGLFVIYVGFFEILFILIVHVELSRYTQSIVVRPMEERCWDLHEDGKLMNFLSYGILACILLSVARCLAQSYAVGRLSRSDVASMTKVYLLPATYFVLLLCVRLWLHLYEKSEPSQVSLPDRIVCYQRVQLPMAVVSDSPVTFNLFVLAFMTFNFMYDYAISGCKQDPELSSHGHLCFDFARQQQRKSLKQAPTYTKYTLPCRPPTHLPTTLLNDNEETFFSSPLGAEKSRIYAPVMNAPSYPTSTARVEHSYPTPVKSMRMYFPGDTPRSLVPPSFTCRSSSIWQFLSSSARMYLAMALYFIIFVGSYRCIVNALFDSVCEDFAPVIFTSVVIINALLRAMQIAFARTINEEEKQVYVANCDMNQSRV